MKKLKTMLMILCTLTVFFTASVVQAAVQKGPGIPSLVSAQATGYDSVKVTWKKAENAHYYWVYYLVNNKWVRLGKTQGTSFEHKSSEKHPLVPGKTYSYTVKAFKNDGTYGKYQRKGISVKLPVPKIGAVSNLQVVCKDYNKMQITWDKAAGAKYYRVYIKQNGKWVKIGTTKGNTFTHKSSSKAKLKVGDYFYYTVRGCAQYGGKTFTGTYSKTGKRAKVRPQTPVPVSAEMSGTDRVVFTWKKAEGAVKYSVFYKKPGGSWIKLAEVGSSATSYTHVSSSQFPLEAGETYVYSVTSYSEYGNINSLRNEAGASVQFMSASYAIDQKVHAQAQAVIARLTTPDMSQYQKLNTCFSWIMSSNYRPSWDPDIHAANWEYQCAYDYLCSHTGNCYGFAYGFAALARELGYYPYVVHIPGVHCFVRIDGGYWDNMYGGKRGAATSTISYTSDQIKPF